MVEAPPRHPACSTSAVRAPHRAAATAAATPALPPPTTMTSKMSCLLIGMCSCSPARLCLPPTGDGRLRHRHSAARRCCHVRSLVRYPQHWKIPRPNETRLLVRVPAPDEGPAHGRHAPALDSDSPCNPMFLPAKGSLPTESPRTHDPFLLLACP